MNTNTLRPALLVLALATASTLAACGDVEAPSQSIGLAAAPEKSAPEEAGKVNLPTMSDYDKRRLDVDQGDGWRTQKEPPDSRP